MKRAALTQRMRSLRQLDVSDAGVSFFRSFTPHARSPAKIDSQAPDCENSCSPAVVAIVQKTTKSSLFTTGFHPLVPERSLAELGQPITMRFDHIIA